MAASDRSVRASDADRESAAASLRDHYAAGRLNGDEFNERLDKAYAAKTLADLDALMTDLPAPADPGRLPEQAQPAGWLADPSGRFSPAWRAAWGSWLSISLVCFVIWLLSGATANLWFLWPSGILGATLLARWLTGGPAMSDRRVVRRQYRHDYRRYHRGF